MLLHAALAFAHGSNDVANAIGPLAAIVNVVQSGGVIAVDSTSPAWILLIGAAGIVFGLATLGHKVIKTVGEKITKLTPSLGFSANMSASTTIVLATYLGFPISTTHTLVGACDRCRPCKFGKCPRLKTNLSHYFILAGNHSNGSIFNCIILCSSKIYFWYLIF